MITWSPSLKPNWLSTGYQVQSPSIVFVGAVDTIIFLGRYRDLICLYHWFGHNMHVAETCYGGQISLCVTCLNLVTGQFFSAKFLEWRKFTSVSQSVTHSVNSGGWCKFQTLCLNVIRTRF